MLHGCVLAMLLGIAATIGAGLAPSAASAAVGSVTVSSPPNVGRIQSGAPDVFIGLTASGYVEEEFFLTGVATKHGKSGTWTSDGLWTVTPTGQEPYTTRVIVRRPAKARDFNGTVLVEWFNVTRGYDAESTFAQTWPLIEREGYAYVGVSAQKVGIDALPVVGNAIRYAAVHSGSSDGFSYDIFSQAGHAARTQSAILLGGLSSARVLALGTSQSAGRLVTYVNAIHPVANVFDGFLIHARSAAGAALDTGVSVPSPSFSRVDLTVPVFTVNSETDVTGYFPARQPDSPIFREWEVAGSAHNPWFRSQYSNAQNGLPLDTNPCATHQNDMPFHHVLQTALAHLNAWVADVTAPPSLPKIDIQGTPRAIQRDQYGNALGGIRLPEMNVPVARYGPSGATSSTDSLVRLLCNLAGTVDYWSNTPEPPSAGPPADLWPDPPLKDLYRNHGAYVSAFTQATRAAVKAGYLLEPDAQASIDAAAHADVGK